jgi:hypothetical protein
MNANMQRWQAAREALEIALQHDRDRVRCA